MAVEIVSTDTIAEAAQILSSNRKARLFAGGTMLMCAINYGDQSLGTLVRCGDPALSEIKSEGENIRIGSAVTMTKVLQTRELSFLEKAARSVGGPAIRTAATVGGNLFAPPPYGDFATALLALGATIEFAGGSSISADDFFGNRDRYSERLVTAVLVPRINDADALRFLKVTRVRPKGAAVLTIAAYLPRRAGQIEGFRIAYGNVAPTPIRATAAERALEGASLDESGISAALAAACQGIDPLTDSLASSWYRREVVPVHLKRVLLNREL